MAEQQSLNCVTNPKNEMLQIIASVHYFMENQTRIINSLISQINELQARVESCEISKEINSKTRLDELANEDTPTALPRAIVNQPACMEGNESLIHSIDPRIPCVGAGASPIAPRRSCITSTRRQEVLPRTMQQPTDLCEDRRASLGTNHPVPLPRTIRPVPLPRSINSPIQAQMFTASPIAAEKIKLSPQKCSREQVRREARRCQQEVKVAVTEVHPPSSPRSLRAKRSPPISRTPLLPRLTSPSRHSPSPPSSRSTGRHRKSISPRWKGPSASRMHRIMERGVRGHIRCFIAGRNFCFVTREDNGENIFLHRNEVIKFLAAHWEIQRRHQGILHCSSSP